MATSEHPAVQHCPSEAKVSMKSAALQGLLAQLKQKCCIVYCAKASKKLEFGSGTDLKSANIEEIQRALSRGTRKANKQMWVKI